MHEQRLDTHMGIADGEHVPIGSDDEDERDDRVSDDEFLGDLVPTKMHELTVKLETLTSMMSTMQAQMLEMQARMTAPQPITPALAPVGHAARAPTATIAPGTPGGASRRLDITGGRMRAYSEERGRRSQSEDNEHAPRRDRSRDGRVKPGVV